MTQQDSALNLELVEQLDAKVSACRVIQVEGSQVLDLTLRSSAALTCMSGVRVIAPPPLHRALAQTKRWAVKDKYTAS
jgi:hypothetical protein